MAFNLKKLSVLFVENMEEMRELITSVLETLDVGEIYTANEGGEAFDLLCEKNPDIVITEWYTEPESGIDLTLNIRRHPSSPDHTIPVIITTGFNSKEHIATARDSGVTEYMVKPFTAKDLAKRLEHVINRPAEFIDNGEYFGPDRRRRQNPDYKGPFRRADDKK